MTILEVKDLLVDYMPASGKVEILRNINFKVAENTIVGITGVSGSGKSMTALSILGLNNDSDNIVTKGSIFFKGQDIGSFSEHQWSDIRNKKISIIFQDPEAALNPVIRCGKQIREVLILHQVGISASDATKIVHELLKKVGFDDTERVYNSYPNELSGGQQQRIVIAISIANNAEIIIADEATSSLDAQTSAGIIDLLLKIKKENGCSIIFITHDIRLLLKISDQIILLNEGKISCDFINKPEVIENLDKNIQKYLTLSIPFSNDKAYKHSDILMLEVNELSKVYKTGGLFFGKSESQVLKNITFKLYKGEILGILGVTGSGKSTLGNIIAGITESSSGSVNYCGKKIDIHAYRMDKTLRRNVQLIQQNSYTSFNPKQSVRDVLSEIIDFYSLATGKLQVDLLLSATLHEMGLPEDVLSRNTAQLSGGQRQRLSIARALLLKPEIIIFDESLSALDIQNQIQILSLIQNLQANHSFSAIFISHDPTIIRYISSDLIVMDQGQIIEEGKTSDIFRNPKQDLTKKLIGG